MEEPMPTNKVVALACFFIGFGLSLGCLVYSILNLVRIHRKRKAANLLEPMTPEEFQREMTRLEGKLDA